MIKDEERAGSYGGEQPNIYEEIVISSGSLAIDFDPAQVIDESVIHYDIRRMLICFALRSAGSRRPSSSPSRSESRRLRSEIFPPLPTNKYTHYSLERVRFPSVSFSFVCCPLGESQTRKAMALLFWGRVSP